MIIVKNIIEILNIIKYKSQIILFKNANIEKKQNKRSKLKNEVIKTEYKLYFIYCIAFVKQM